jgi:hypothetical protein
LPSGNDQYSGYGTRVLTTGLEPSIPIHRGRPAVLLWSGGRSVNDPSAASL